MIWFIFLINADVRRLFRKLKSNIRKGWKNEKDLILTLNKILQKDEFSEVLLKERGKKYLDK